MNQDHDTYKCAVQCKQEFPGTFYFLNMAQYIEMVVHWQSSTPYGQAKSKSKSKMFS